MAVYNVRINPDSMVPNGHLREHCVATKDQVYAIGSNMGRQVRVKRLDVGGDIVDFALYTVINLHNNDPALLQLGYRDPESTNHDLHDRLGTSSTSPFDGEIDSQVTHLTYTDAQAEANSEFVERLIDNGNHIGLIAIAPHGGNIEHHTDEQAEQVRTRLSDKCISVWVCKGWKAGGGAFDRWHITSTEIHEDSFPLLKTVINRKFKFAVAFHGWREDSICVGGTASTSLKNEVRDAIASIVPITVTIDAEGGCPSGFSGSNPQNIINRLSDNGLQIEQSSDARNSYAIQIANAVADVLNRRIRVCKAPVFSGSSTLVCLLRAIGLIIIIAILLILIWIPSVRCLIKKLQYKIENCRDGNSDFCIEF